MDTKKLAHDLNSLIKLDIDAIHAYEQAVEKIDIPSIRDELNRFKADHLRHVDDLTRVVKAMGFEAAEFKRDFKGFIIEGMTALRSTTGTEGALKAMRMNEQLTNSRYDAALKWDLTPEVRRIIEKNREDERRHLEAIERAINARVWERGAA